MAAWPPDADGHAMGGPGRPQVSKVQRDDGPAPTRKVVKRRGVKRGGGAKRRPGVGNSRSSVLVGEKTWENKFLLFENPLHTDFQITRIISHYCRTTSH